MRFDFAQWVSVAEYETGQITAYPNPANNHVTVTATTDGEITCQLLNLQGQLLQTRNSEDAKCVMNLDNIPAGCYLIKVLRDGKHLQTLKIIKQ